MIYRLPIANRHYAILQREKELYEELDQVNAAIKELCNHKIFVV